jgi:hypothetical protein
LTAHQTRGFGTAWHPDIIVAAGCMGNLKMNRNGEEGAQRMHEATPSW